MLLQHTINQSSQNFTRKISAEKYGLINRLLALTEVPKSRSIQHIIQQILPITIKHLKIVMKITPILLVLVFCSCSIVTNHKRSYKEMNAEWKQEMREKGTITYEGKAIPINELDKKEVDLLKANGQPKIFFLVYTPWDTPESGFSNIKQFDELAAYKDYQKIFVSLGYQDITIYALQKVLSTKPDKAYFLSNEAFGAGFWKKPINFLEYLTGESLNKKDLNLPLWVVLDSSGKTLYKSTPNSKVSDLANSLSK